MTRLEAKPPGYSGAGEERQECHWLASWAARPMGVHTETQRVAEGSPGDSTNPDREPAKTPQRARVERKQSLRERGMAPRYGSISGARVVLASPAPDVSLGSPCARSRAASPGTPRPARGRQPRASGTHVVRQARAGLVRGTNPSMTTQWLGNPGIRRSYPSPQQVDKITSGSLSALLQRSTTQH